MPDSLSEITRAARAYYGQLQRITVTETDFQDWLRQLPSHEQAGVATSGFAAACTRRSFQRFCLEWRGYRMREFMGEQLSIQAFALWQKLQRLDGELPESHG